jgi:hypothetical protein
MNRFWRRLFLLGALAFVPASILHAKRVAPKEVSPVLFNGVQYSADGDGRNAYVVAADATSGKTLCE